MQLSLADFLKLCLFIFCCCNSGKNSGLGGNQGGMAEQRICEFSSWLNRRPHAYIKNQPSSAQKNLKK